MGMCIVYRAVGAAAVLEQAFGRWVPLALGPLLAAEDEREPLRGAARERNWGSYLPRRPEAFPPGEFRLPTLWGGPPASVYDAGQAHLAAGDVRAVAETLRAVDAKTLRNVYARERERLATPLSAEDCVEDLALLQEFFSAACEARCEVVIRWEYR